MNSINSWVEPEWDHWLPNASELERRFDRLWPICRSLTGDGVRKTLSILAESIPLEIGSVPSGTQVFDWTVPNEWNIESAYLEDESGGRWADFSRNNLHALNYSVPVDRWMNRPELDPHLYSLPDLPEAIPYVTSYYKERWGFCLSQREREQLPEGRLRAVIRSRLEPGVLNYGHYVLPSTSVSKPADEILISTYICHPSMANNELSGPLVATALYEALSRIQFRRFSYRFVFIPETIGAIAYLSQHGKEFVKRCHAGLVVTCVGDGRAVNYKKSRRGDAPVDFAAEHVLKRFPGGLRNVRIREFFPTGSDERHYCSPGFNLPVGSITRSMHGEYPEYHTSLDDKSFIDFIEMRRSVEIYLRVLGALELNSKYRNLAPFGEPMLEKRDLYPTLGAGSEIAERQRRIAYLLAYSDGANDLLSIAEKADCDILSLAEPVSALMRADLLSADPA